jgi:hypothetical protein
MKDSEPQRCPHSMRTHDNVEQVREAMLCSPHRSTRRQALTWFKGQLRSANSARRFTLPSLQNPSCPGNWWTGQGKPTWVLESILRLGEKQSQHSKLITGVQCGPLPNVRLCEKQNCQWTAKNPCELQLPCIVRKSQCSVLFLLTHHINNVSNKNVKF